MRKCFVREALLAHNSATRATKQHRFFIGTDNSCDNIVVYKFAKRSKAMPNLFKY